MDKETRFINIELEDVETRDDAMVISGYAIRFDSLSEDLGGFKELISDRALDGVDMTDVYLYNQHKSDEVLGNTASGTLALNITSKGLHFRAELPQTTLGKDTYTLLKRGDLKSMSFGFRVLKDTWDLTQEPSIRTINAIKILDEISVVSRPAYKDTSVSTRAKQMCADGQCLRKCKEPNPLVEEALALLKSIS